MIQHTTRIKYNDGRTESVYYLLEEDRFRFVLDYNNWHKPKDGEPLYQAILRVWSEICKTTWPDKPEFWPSEIQPAENAET